MINPQDTLKLIRQRRTVKPALFNDKVISDETINDILESANWAPNHGRTEPWRLNVYTGPGLSQYKETIETVWNENPEMQRPGKLEKWTSNIPYASHIIAFGMKRCESRAIPLVEEVCAVSCAAQNMMLVATAHGVASYWSSGVAHFPTSAKAFGLDGDEDCMLGFLHLGYIDSDFEPGCRKTSIDTKVTWIKS